MFHTIDEPWELRILDAAPPAFNLGSLSAGDVDGDGNVEMITGGAGGLWWYRPATAEKGLIDHGEFHVGNVLEDVDGDGLPELVMEVTGETKQIRWYKPQGELSRPWEKHVIEPNHTGSAHDVLFADVDGDGARELIAIAAYTDTPGIFIYKPAGDVTRPWRRHVVDEGHFADGTCAADLDGDGRIEIVSGPAWYHAPAGGALSGPWERRVFAPNFREMCRTTALDITGNGRPDIVISEAEYFRGLLCWFENRLGEAGGPWVEHRLMDDLTYAHSLASWRDERGAHFFVAEMASGGWDAPYNYDARLLEFVTRDNGANWERKLIYRGAGTHEAVPFDLDGDGRLEIAGKEWKYPKVQLFRRREKPSKLSQFQHRLIDRDKPYTATDIFAMNVSASVANDTRSGANDIVCGAWWYENGGWQRRRIPGIYQAHCAYDIDGDGRDEIIATRPGPASENWYERLTSELCWLKAIDPANGEWQEHTIGVGSGDWPHGSVVAPLGAGGRPALVIGYHNAAQGYPPEMFEIPDDPAAGPWPKRVLAEIPYGEQIVPCDLDGSGRVDLMAGPYWLENLGDGDFTAHQIAEDFAAARVRVADINGDGRADVVLGEEALDYENGRLVFSRLAWFEQPADPTSCPWPAHVIDKLRCPHSLSVADLDGDGQLEVVAAEHDPSNPYRARCRLFVYKKADPAGRTWYRHLIDARFEHHDGAQLIELAPGRLGIISHGWTDSRYVHLWEPR